MLRVEKRYADHYLRMLKMHPDDKLPLLLKRVHCRALELCENTRNQMDHAAMLAVVLHYELLDATGVDLDIVLDSTDWSTVKPGADLRVTEPGQASQAATYVGPPQRGAKLPNLKDKIRVRFTQDGPEKYVPRDWCRVITLTSVEN